MKVPTSALARSWRVECDFIDSTDRRCPAATREYVQAEDTGACLDEAVVLGWSVGEHVFDLCPVHSMVLPQGLPRWKVTRQIDTSVLDDRTKVALVRYAARRMKALRWDAASAITIEVIEALDAMVESLPSMLTPEQLTQIDHAASFASALLPITTVRPGPDPLLAAFFSEHAAQVAQVRVSPDQGTGRATFRGAQLERMPVADETGDQQTWKFVSECHEGCPHASHRFSAKFGQRHMVRMRNTAPDGARPVLRSDDPEVLALAAHLASS